MAEINMQEDMGGIFGGLTSKKFDNPFFLPSSAYYPTTLSEAFDFCRFLYFTVPVYRQVAKRTVRYFITDFEFPGKGSMEEKEQLKDYLTYTLRLPAIMADMGDEWGCYGNAFTTFYYPFTRVLVDTRGNLTKYYSLETFANMQERIKFNLHDLTYEVPDPKDGFKSTATFEFIDIPTKDKNKLAIRILDPRNLRIQFNEISGKSRYILRFNARVKSNIESNYRFAIDDTPRDMLEAVRDNNDFAFFDGEVFHFRSPVVSGLSYQNWGLPEPIANFRQIYQILIYQKLDEAVALDYMLPFRLFSAETNSSGAGRDLLQTMDMNVWTSEIGKIIEARRKDKFAMHAFPFPVNYQEFGGNGKQFTPKDLLEFQINNLFDCCGFPQDLFKGNLALQQMPTALRLFQNSFWFLYDNFNTFTRWAVKKVKDFLEEEQVEVKLQMPKYADNLEMMNLKMQLGQAGELPRSVYLSALGINNGVDAAVERAEEDLQIQIKTQQKQEEAERKAQAQSQLEQELIEDANGLGVQPTPQGNSLEERAMMKAQEWASIPTTGERTKAMEATKAESFELYSMAKQIYADQRKAQVSEAKQLVAQQAMNGGMM